MLSIIQNFAKPTLIKPTAPPSTETLDAVDTLILEKKVTHYVKMLTTIDADIRKLFGVIWGRCTHEMQDRIKLETNYSQMDDTSDGIALLKAIKVLSEITSTKRDPFQTLYSALLAELTIRQDNKTIGAYRDHINNLLDALTHSGGEICSGNGIFTSTGSLRIPKVVYDNKDTAGKLLVEEAARKRFIDRIFINGANPRKFGMLQRDLHNNHVHKIDKYPNNLDEAVELLHNWQSESNTEYPTDTGVSFLQDDVDDEADVEEDLHLLFQDADYDQDADLFMEDYNDCYQADEDGELFFEEFRDGISICEGGPQWDGVPVPDDVPCHYDEDIF